MQSSLNLGGHIGRTQNCGSQQQFRFSVLFSDIFNPSLGLSLCLSVIRSKEEWIESKKEEKKKHNVNKKGF